MGQGTEGRDSGTRLSRRYLVSGRVQGVGFRYHVLRRAQSLDLVGWVRNRPDGRVEAEAHGSAGSLAEFEAHLRQGPRFSCVTNVEIIEIPGEPPIPTAFEIKG